jgi:phospholipase D1/2
MSAAAMKAGGILGSIGEAANGESRDSSVSPMSSPRSNSTLATRPKIEHQESQPRIASPLRMEHAAGASGSAAIGQNGALFAPAPVVDQQKPSPNTDEESEFPFTARPGVAGVRPTTTELVHRIDHVSSAPVGEAADRATGLASSVNNGTLSRKQTLEGDATPQGRRSVQFIRPANMEPGQAGHSREPSWAGETAEGAGKKDFKQLMSKLKALTSSSTGLGHARSLSGLQSSPMSAEEEAALGEHRFGEDEGDADADAEESAAEGTGKLNKTRKRRRFHRDASEGPHTAPTTPKASKMPSFRREATERTPPTSSLHTVDELHHSRPTFILRRNTMSDIPENQRLAMSEDEGRDRLAAERIWRRGSAWVHNHSLSYSGAGPSSGGRQLRNGDESPETKRPSGLRRLTAFGVHDGAEGSPSPWRFGERTTSVSAQKWRQLKAGLKMLGARKREEHRIEHAKSAELMAELLAGAPAAVIFASMFQRDDRGHKRIPVLLEQLKVKITDSTRDEKEKHPIFRIELEYGSSLARMKWPIYRSLGDFLNLHLKYKSSGTLDKYTHMSRPTERSKLPKFPKSGIPGLRTLLENQTITLDDEDDEDDEDEHTAGEQSGMEGEASGLDRPGKPKRRQSSFNFIRKKPSGPTRLNTGDDAARSGSISGAAAFSARRQETFAERQRRKLEQYLEKLITFVMFRPDSNRLCKFLELSALGVRLATEGYHGKEGELRIKSSRGVDYRSSINIGLFKARHTPKWFLIRHSYVVCVDSPEEMNVYEVILVDSDFRLDKKKSTARKRDENPKALAQRAKASAKDPSSHVLRIANSERLYKLLAKNHAQLIQFEKSIEFMASQTEWAQKHRYESFAPVRQNVWAQPLVDGRDYMWNVSRAISMARDVIYIHDWWLTPELYMRRPAAIAQKWRLDRLLKRKADEGVKIYVIMYRNINSAIPIDSEYSKFSLLDLSENVYVQRSPNQLRQNTFFWAHHEKICVIDHCVAFCGGVDLCFGRWDTPNHPVVDDKLTGFEESDQPKDADHCQLWPGKDYSNPRVQDFYNLSKPYEEMYDRSKVPRMPWHDIGMQIVGQPARDLSRHFVQRWNFILRQRTPSRPTPFLLPPTDFLPADIEALGLNGTCEIQILRSACLWSLGTPNKVECSIMNAYVDMIENSEHFVYIENQFFITSCEVDGTKIENKIGDALFERIVRAFENDEDWRAIIMIPLMPGFQNTVDAADGSSVRLIMTCQYQSICRGDTSLFSRLRARDIEPEDYIEFYALRSWGKIGPDKALVTEQLYIHAKVMIVDDRVAIIGSANINERSMLGSRDSEVAAIVRDTDMLQSYMAGEDYEVAKFAHELRVRLMREHLGIDTDRCREEELNDELWQREVDNDARENDDDADSVASKESDRAVERRLIENKHRLQEELIAKQEQLHSFNHDVDWTQANNQNIRTTKKKTTDPRVIGNQEHEKDVLGEGFDNMAALGDPTGRDTVIDQRGMEILVSGSVAATEGKGSLASPVRPLPSTRTRPRARTTGEQEPEFLPPQHLPRMNTSELGLPQLSQLPALPVTDDSDIGGPALQRTLSSASLDVINPLLLGMKRPIVTDNCMRDPIIDTFFLDTWHTIAENNTRIYRQVFRCMPDNEVRTWRQYREYDAFSERFKQAQGVKHEQEKMGQTGPPGSGAVNEKIGKIVNAMDKGVPPEREQSEILNEKSEKLEPPAKEGLRASPSTRTCGSPANLNGGSKRRRRRATTRSSHRPFHADDENAMLSKHDAEELLKLIQGTVVVWPYDWLAGEGWRFAVDQLAPLEIYT